jgi:hypothetical protein
MTKGERDYKLELFLKFTDRGKTPPKSLMDYISDGVREFLRDGKPWQIGSGGRPRRPYTTALQCKALAVSGVSVDRTALILSMTSEDGKDYTKKIKRFKDDAEGFFNNSAADYTNLCVITFAIDELLEENEVLTRKEREGLEQLKEDLNRPHTIDDVEPKYGH